PNHRISRNTAPEPIHREQRPVGANRTIQGKSTETKHVAMGEPQESEETTQPETPKPSRRSLRQWMRVVGPGVITGAAGDDPAGIGTYSQVGAQSGTGLLW